jgi:hypothetical protein
MQEKMVSYKAGNLPPASEESQRLFKLAMAKPDSEIDTSNIPEITEGQFRNAVRGKLSPQQGPSDGDGGYGRLGVAEIGRCRLSNADECDFA